jgi:Tol biopolymer transport system component
LTADRWRQVEDLCHAVLSRPAAERTSFLSAACAGDPALQQEVESLLAGESSAEAFMSVPAAALTGSGVLEQPTNQLVGQRFGSYTIGALLGVGGMGEVYRARDEILGRDVAIKVLPLAFTAEPERRARFEREARTLATLNHPHIGAIYGLEEANGVRGLVLELVEGETLAERIAARARSRDVGVPGLSLPEVFVIARQVAEALAAAHDKGIVHRDLKPANIKITPDGVAKILDFGLAKAAGTESSPPDPTQSCEGVILGTAAYMSPEQARGQGVDKRADVWAFGCVLYEKLTGRAAFAGDTVSDTIARILERQPDWSALPADTPPALRRVLARCLVKDARKRLRDIGDVWLDLDSTGEILSTAAPGTADRAAPRRRAWLPWAALAALATVVAIREGVRGVPPNDLASGARFTPITDWEGTEAAADISPDGRFVTFLADRDGQFDLWWTQIGTGRFSKLTPLAPGPPAQRRPSDVLKTFGFSGEGDDVWISMNPAGPRPSARFALTGGPPRPILGDGGTALAWSPDGARLAYMKIVASRPGAWMGDVILVADRVGGDPREIVGVEPQVHNHNPVWSADGQWVYFLRGVGPFEPLDAMDVWRIRPSGGRPERVTNENGTVSFLAPLDTRTLLYVGRAPDGSGPWLWSVDLDRRNARPRRLTVGAEQYTSVAASRDGRRIVATVVNPSSTLWRVPLRESGVAEGEAEPYLVPADRASAPRFSGSSIFYLASSGGYDGLWRLSDGQPLPIRSGSDGAILDAPAITRDGARVAFVPLRAGERRLTVMSSDGTSPRTIASSIHTRGSVDWSPDGKSIVTGGTTDSSGQGAGLYRVPLDGGAPVLLVRGEAFDPVWSPDGGLIVYVDRMAGSVPLLAVRPDGTPVDMPLPNVRVGGYRFLPGGKRLVYMPHLQSRDFWLLDLEARTNVQITHLADRGALHWFDVTPDGQSLVFDRSRANANVVLIELPKRP